MKLVILAAALVMPASAPSAPQEGTSTPAIAPQPMPGGTEMPNAFVQGSGCLPIIQQVQEQAKRSRRNEHRTLDREPSAHLLLAVDRQVNGCREVTFLRRDAAPAATTPVLPGR